MLFRWILPSAAVLLLTFHAPDARSADVRATEASGYIGVFLPNVLALNASYGINAALPVTDDWWIEVERGRYAALLGKGPMAWTSTLRVKRYFAGLVYLNAGIGYGTKSVDEMGWCELPDACHRGYRGVYRFFGADLGGGVRFKFRSGVTLGIEPLNILVPLRYLQEPNAGPKHTPDENDDVAARIRKDRPLPMRSVLSIGYSFGGKERLDPE